MNEFPVNPTEVYKMPHSNKNYAPNYFIYPKLTKIHGELTFDILNRIRNEIKANLTSISSDLGGRGHVHLGLGLLPMKYATISGTPYVHPMHPGATPLTRSTNNETMNLHDDWKRVLRIYCEVIDIEKTIIRKLQRPLTRDILKLSLTQLQKQ